MKDLEVKVIFDYSAAISLCDDLSEIITERLADPESDLRASLENIAEACRRMAADLRAGPPEKKGNV